MRNSAHSPIILRVSRGPLRPRDFSVAFPLFLRRRKTRKIGDLCKNSSAGADWTLGRMRQPAVLAAGNAHPNSGAETVLSAPRCGDGTGCRVATLLDDEVGAAAEDAVDEVLGEVDGDGLFAGEIGRVDAAVHRPGAEVSPAARAGRLAGEDRGCAAVAADRRVALRVERVDDHVVLLDVFLHLLVGEHGQHVDADAVHVRVDGDNRGLRALAPFRAPQAADEGVVLAADGQQGLGLPHVAATLLPLGREVEHAEAGRLFVHGQRGRERDDVEVVFAGDAVASGERFGEVDPRVDEENLSAEPAIRGACGRRRFPLFAWRRGPPRGRRRLPASSGAIPAGSAARR